MKKHLINHLNILLIFILLLAISIVPVLAGDSLQYGNLIPIFLPLIGNGNQTGFSISGQVTDLNNNPLIGVTITTDAGLTTMTDSSGNYSLDGLSNMSYTLAPYLPGHAFYPPKSQVVVPPDVSHVNFSAVAICSEAIVNGGFENDTGWELPITEYTAGYSTDLFHSGTRSMRTGIPNPADNRYSYSSARQAVTIPANATSATLSFWIYPISSESTSTLLPTAPLGETFGKSALASDIQYVIILNQYDQMIDQLVWQRSNSRVWTYYTFDLMKYAGSTIQVQFGTYNDGIGGITSLYVDDVSLDICPPSVVPTPTNTPPPGACSNFIQNSSFEYTGVWEIPITVWSAGYSTDRAHTGSRSMRTGITNPLDNRYSYSDARQTVTIPANATSTTLGFWVYPISGDPASMPLAPRPAGMAFGKAPLASDVQYVLILDQFYNWIDTLVWQRSNSQAWTYFEFNLMKYAGKTIRIQFGTYNDGFGGVSSMYMDDMTLDICTNTTPTPTSPPTATPLPTNTPTPTLIPTPTFTPAPSATPSACLERITNGGFENDSAWELPITEYTAGYSTALFHSGARSMRTGIVIPADNRYSYSSTRQLVSIPSNAVNATVSFWLYPISGEAASLPVPSIPKVSVFGITPLAGDVQYVIILDPYNNWIDTLVWQRVNTQAWTYSTFDLKRYAGQSIKLHFGTYNDGYGGITALYVDDVSLITCIP